MSKAEPIIFDALYIIRGPIYPLNEWKEEHTKISQEFWKTFTQKTK